MNNEMIQKFKWYSDKNISIFFSEMPYVSVRYIQPNTSSKEKKSAKQYPFINKKEFTVTIFDHNNNESYEFIIPKGYCFDGASIPRFFWRVIGASTDNSFLIPALIHDILCEHHEYIDNNRSLSTNVFNALLCASDVKGFKRFLMKNSVACFQTLFCDW